jgi:FSR family fosmidomycin resistance protein-like MFS transporter
MPASVIDLNSKRTQWQKLIAITLIHFLNDTIGGMFPAVLPEIRIQFDWNLATVNWVLFSITLICNFAQVATGHLRPDKQKPLLMPLGLIITVAICFLFLLGNSAFAFQGMVVLAIVTGFGIAIIHPEGLRAVHALDKIPNSIAITVFVTGGVLGFACGGYFGSFFVFRFGLQGLMWFLVVPCVSLFLIYHFDIRLAVENKLSAKSKSSENGDDYPFWIVFAMAVPATTGAMLLVMLLPTQLNEMGFDLPYGGFSTMLFGVGGAIGSIVWSIIAHKKGLMRCSVISVLMGIPFILAYILTMKHTGSLALLLLGSFCSWSSYPLLVAVSKFGRGPSLGMRMGLMVGGTWGTSCIIETFLVLLEARYGFGILPLLLIAPACYLITAMIGIALMVTHRQRCKDSAQ